MSTMSSGLLEVVVRLEYDESAERATIKSSSPFSTVAPGPAAVSFRSSLYTDLSVQTRPTLLVVIVPASSIHFRQSAMVEGSISVSGVIVAADSPFAGAAHGVGSASTGAAFAAGATAVNASSAMVEGSISVSGVIVAADSPFAGAAHGVGSASTGAAFAAGATAVNASAAPSMAEGSTLARRFIAERAAPPPAPREQCPAVMRFRSHNIRSAISTAADN